MRNDYAGATDEQPDRHRSRQRHQVANLAPVSFLAAFLGLCLPSEAAAHALLVECRLRHDQIEVRAVFDDGTRPRGAKVRVLDDNGNEIAAGTTGEDGLWQFASPPVGKYRVVVDAGAGHRSETTITVGSPPLPDGRISTGPSEEEFTRFKAVQIVIGLSLIALFCLVLWFIHRWNKDRVRQSHAPRS
ncbi:MAG: hypothetical protein NZM31_10740 [Gemmatales bacterium]|nr:hypothetical protein [Gemmatales bacterium]MDW8387473.1 hypothetical protein [Gemmatales bacterium]